ncbi:MAG: sigma-70 family RNA polymerase sigma factor [Planctomycetes bacterium]|nr:sigma-70 family RNA polymerase sigma factor [Planctomycetota bacterium]
MEDGFRKGRARPICLLGTFPGFLSSISWSHVSADDRRLIAECLQGRTAAFGELVRRYQDRLYNTVYRLVGNAEDAQDVLQDAFFHAYQSLDRFRGNSLFFTWLYRIAFNTAMSLKRKQRVALRLNTGGEEGGLEPLDESEESRPGHALEKAEQERHIQQALQRLSAEHRAVLILKDMEGQKYEAIAAILQVPVGTVRSRLHRARLELRHLLEKEE